METSSNERKRSPDGLTIAQAYRPPGIAAPRGSG